MPDLPENPPIKGAVLLPLTHPPHHQNQSPFFRQLPAELRLSIYEYILSPFGQIVHVMRTTEDNLRGARCVYGAEEVKTNKGKLCHFHSCWGRSANNWNFRRCIGGRKVDQRGWDLRIWGLVACCWRTNLEFLPLLYKTQTFSFRQTQALRLFASGPLPYTHLIRSLRLDTLVTHTRLSALISIPSESLDLWKLTCTAIAKMPKLDNLLVVFDIRVLDEPSLQQMVDIMEPLREIRVGDFRIRLLRHEGLWRRAELDLGLLKGKIGEVPFLLEEGFNELA